MAYVLFTDLDGTLLDLHTGEAGPAAEALRALKERGIPVVFASAKTRAEQEVLRGALGVEDPFIVENGGAIFLPEGYFPQKPEGAKVREGYWVLELGLPYGEIRRRLKRAEARLGSPLVGYGDLSAEEVARRTGLGLEAARRAKAREYDETLFLEEPVEEALKALEAEGLRWSHGGRFYHAHGPNDKGQAVRLLKELYQRFWGPVVAVGLGDSANDRPLLEAVDLAALVERPEGGWHPLDLPGLWRVPGAGPEGFARAASALLEGRWGEVR